jgi:arylsulfatase A-like enzyme
MTGVSPRDTGLLDNTHALAPEAVTLAERFRANGWATCAVVSAAHLDAEWSGLGQGFDRVGVSAAPKRDAGATLGVLEDWLPDYRGRPLFVWLHLFDAHTPYGPPQPMLARFWPDGRDPSDPSLPEPPPNSIPRNLKGVRDVEWIRASYKGEVAYLDNELARLFSEPRIQAAIVAFTADHGESLGGHGIWWDHASLYQDSLHVPLILRWPGGPRGQRVVSRVSNIDIGRTLLDLAALARTEMPGRSLLPLVEGRARPAAVFAVACFGFSASITDGDEHLVLHLLGHNLAPDVVKERHAYELFDLARDPDCLHDLASERPARAHALRAQLVAWLRAVESRPWSRNPAGNGASIERLEAIGYTAGEERDPAAALFPAQCACAQCAGAQ